MIKSLLWCKSRMVKEIQPDKILNLKTFFNTTARLVIQFFILSGMSDGLTMGSLCEAVGQTEQGCNAVCRGRSCEAVERGRDC